MTDKTEQQHTMENTGEQRKIFDFFFSGCEVPESLREKFALWLEEHGDEPLTRQILMEYWDSASAESGNFDMEKGLEKLMSMFPETRMADRLDNGAECPAGCADECLTESDRSGVSDMTAVKGTAVSGVRRPFLRKALKCLAAAAAAAVLFISGAAVAMLTGGMTETVLVASDKNIASHELPDGSKIWLNKGSRLSFNGGFGLLDRTVSLDGEGFFEVAKDASKPFIVKMDGGMQLKVLGTSFNASAYKGSGCAEVILRTGSVQVSDSRSDEKVILKPDQRYLRAGGMTEINQVNASDCCRWYEHRLVFDNARFQDILSTLSHKYLMTFDLKARNLEGKRMSLTVRDESPEEILDVLSFLLPIRWEMQDNRITIRNKPQK